MLYVFYVFCEYFWNFYIDFVCLNEKFIMKFVFCTFFYGINAILLC